MSKKHINNELMTEIIIKAINIYRDKKSEIFTPVHALTLVLEDYDLNQSDIKMLETIINKRCK